MSSLRQYPKLPKKVNINFRNSSIAVHGVTECVLRRLEGTFFHVSSNKYGSNVVEKFIQFSDDLHNARIITELVYHPTVAMLLVDPYGNYVMQTALVVSKCAK